MQLIPLRDYAAARGWAAVEYIDHRPPAGDLRRRTSWRELLDEARRRHVDATLVRKLDRAFRSSTHAHATLADPHRHGVGFEALRRSVRDLELEAPVSAA